LDLRAHDESWVRDRLGDRWTGFADAELQRLLEGAGLADVRVNVGARRTGDPFTVLIASGTKPGFGSVPRKIRPEGPPKRRKPGA
jgi:hypothetical protein